MTNPQKIKIALFSDTMVSESFDGVNMTLYTVLRKFPKDKYDVLLITARGPKDPSTFPFPFFKIPYIKVPFYKDYPIVLPQLSLRLNKVLNEFKPDIIHMTTPLFSGPVALRYAKKNKLPVLTIYHTHFITYLKYYIGQIAPLHFALNKSWEQHFRWFYNKVDKILVPTTSIKEDLIDYGIREDHMEIWGRGIETDKFNPEARNLEFIQKLTRNTNKNIFFLSRLAWYKGLHTLVKIYEKIMDERNDVNFIIVGDGPQADFLKKSMPKAFFMGKLPHNEIPKYYASSDVFVFPSDTETFGNVVQEAMACGCPPVVAKAGGPKGIVTDGVNGFHAEPRNVDAFVEKINILLDNQELHDKMAKAGVEYGQSQSWDNLTNKLLNYYEKLSS